MSHQARILLSYSSKMETFQIKPVTSYKWGTVLKPSGTQFLWSQNTHNSQKLELKAFKLYSDSENTTAILTYCT